MKTKKSDIEIIQENGLWSLKTMEPYFSWSPCEGCHNTLGGDRYDIEFLYSLKDTNKYSLSICVECLEEIAS